MIEETDTSRGGEAGGQVDGWLDWTDRCVGVGTGVTR